jgi:myo-inositol-1(or 4)-monophosphatase
MAGDHPRGGLLRSRVRTTRLAPKAGPSSTISEPDGLSRFVTEILRAAGIATLRRPESVWRHPGNGGVVTAVDLEVESFIVESIEARFPDHSFLTEERGEIARDPDHLWVLDPIDGTVNYLRGLDDYCISLCYIRAGRPALAAVYRPVADEMFIALPGRGALRNGQPPQASPSSDTTVVGTGFTTQARMRPQQRELIGKLLLAGFEIREPGSASLGLARVAAGMYDAYVEEGLGPWDIIPGAVLVEEAGGVVTDLAGQPLSPRPQCVIAASSGAVHELVRNVATGNGEARGSTHA